MEDFASHEVHVQVPPRPIGQTSATPHNLDAPVDPVMTLLLTVVVAAVLGYVLLRQGSADKTRPPPPRHNEPEEYFQKIVEDVKLDTWSGTEQGCQWKQTDDEVEVTVPLSSGARSRDVSCKVLPGSIALSVKGASVLQGTLLRKVRHDDCDWGIEELGGERILKLTLVKLLPTKGAQHWTSLLRPPDI